MIRFRLKCLYEDGAMQACVCKHQMQLGLWRLSLAAGALQRCKAAEWLRKQMALVLDACLGLGSSRDPRQTKFALNRGSSRDPCMLSQLFVLLCVLALCDVPHLLVLKYLLS